MLLWKQTPSATTSLLQPKVMRAAEIILAHQNLCHIMYIPPSKKTTYDILLIQKIASSFSANAKAFQRCLTGRFPLENCKLKLTYFYH